MAQNRRQNRKIPNLNQLHEFHRPYGGQLRNTRQGRQSARPISLQDSMHLVLRSTKARGKWSFLRHRKSIKQVIKKFSERYGVHVYSMANVGNHLHFHLRLTRKGSYKKFIRAITSAIVMAVTGACRWRPLKERFWDQRPFSRIVIGMREYLRIQDYIEINQMEGAGIPREKARYIVQQSNRSRAG